MPHGHTLYAKQLETDVSDFWDLDTGRESRLLRRTTPATCVRPPLPSTAYCRRRPTHLAEAVPATRPSCSAIARPGPGPPGATWSRGRCPQPDFSPDELTLAPPRRLGRQRSVWWSAPTSRRPLLPRPHLGRVQPGRLLRGRAHPGVGGPGRRRSCSWDRGAPVKVPATRWAVTRPWLGQIDQPRRRIPEVRRPRWHASPVTALVRVAEDEAGLDGAG